MTDETRELTVQRTPWGDGRASQERRARSRSRAPALTILSHPDPRRVGERALLREVLAGRPAPLSRTEPAFLQPGGGEPRPLGDRHLSRAPLLFRPLVEGGVLLSPNGSRTSVVADGEPVIQDREITGPGVERGVVLELGGRVVLLLHGLSVEPLRAPERFGLVGESEGILRVCAEIRRVADLGVPILLRGETGTGKELAARAIHAASRRRGAPYLCVNMGAIPASLAAAELFGAVKGAYTGATRDHLGFFQRAHGGTLFLDEIGEAPPEVQVMLLRVLESGEVQRVGNSETRTVDVRLLAATDADLESAVEEGRFRAPLLHRLSGYEIDLPPLRQRRDDFGRLLFHLLREELREIGDEHRLAPVPDAAEPWIPCSMVARLARHPWPGNVRQLRNVARQLVIGGRAGGVLEVPPQVERLLREAERAGRERPGPPEPAEPGGPARRRAPDRSYRSPQEVGEQEVVDALRAHAWEVKPAAEQLGISRPSLYNLIEKFPSIRKARDLTRTEILEGRTRAGGDLDATAAHLEVSKKGLQQRMRELGIG
jgi:two-component system, NtrC family, nitrogen regulation response regulator GlnG